MVKKVQAWMSSGGLDGIGTRPVSVEAEPSPYGIHARAVTIIQHHDTHLLGHERVFTESEVREMLLKLRCEYHAPEDVEFLDTLAIDELGIILNPA